MKFYHQLTVRYADTDAQGHVFFANYLTYFDEATTGYLHAIGVSPSTLTEQGVDFVYADAHASYAGSAHFQDHLLIGCTFAKLGNTSVTAQLEILPELGMAPIVTGRVVFVCVGRGTREKVAVPGVLREAVARFEGA